MLRITKTTLKSRDIRLLGTQGCCDFILTQPLSLPLSGELANQTPSLDCSLDKL